MAYAITDEIHQTFVPTRNDVLLDVLIDTSGAAIGLLALAGIHRYRESRRASSARNSYRRRVTRQSLPWQSLPDLVPTLEAFIVNLFRSLITAVAVLALTAALATAHLMPNASDDGLTTAAGAAGKVVPVGHDQADEDAVQEDEQEADENLTREDEQQADETDTHCIAPETEDPEKTGNTENTDEGGATDEQTEEPNHGAEVCGAAQAETPATPTAARTSARSLATTTAPRPARAPRRRMPQGRQGSQQGQSGSR